MRKPINEIERFKLIAGLINEVEYNDAVYGVKRKTVLTEAKKEKELDIDVANPYEFRHGLQYELEQGDDYSDEALKKAKEKVLKNLAKDTNYYFNLLNQQPTGFEFKIPETDKPGMQAKADGYLKKELKKDEKANVKDSLSKSEAAKGKPKGIKIMPDKGVEGKEKTIKEGLEEAKKNKYIVVDEEGDYQLDSNAIKAYLKSAIDPEEIESVDIFMGDDEGYGESSMYFFDNDEDPATTTDKEVEDWAKQEISYYLFSTPDEFPGKEMSEGKEEMNEDFKYFDNYEEFENTLFQLYPQVKANPEKYKKDGIDGEVRYSDGYVNWGSWYPNRPQSYSGLPPGAVNMNNKMSQSDLIYPAGSRMDEDNMESSPVNGDSSAEGQFNQLMSKYDWYYEMSDDPRKYDTGASIDQKLKSLAKTIGVSKAVELFNTKAPSDRKVTSTFFAEGKDKHSKIKEALKKALKEIDPQLQKLGKDEENAERNLAAILTKKAALLNKPGTQG